MDTFEFDGKKYKAASKHQKEWGQDLISQLSFNGNETILDLGCGDGILTEQLALFVPEGNVLGIDASSDMIKTANKLHRDNLQFTAMDINKMHFENQFDIIFSNAALHWIKDHKQLLRNAYNALTSHGIIVWDFAASGNCSNFFDVMHEKMTDAKYINYFKDFEWPWFMPSKSQYDDLISTADFAQYSITEVNRDCFFSNSSELIKWIDQPSIVPFLQCIPQKYKELFRQETIAEMLKRTQQLNGSCFETFRRLKIYAKKFLSQK